MFMVYWTEQQVSRSQQFEKGQLTEVLSFMEALRQRQWVGEAVSFVALSSENPDSVGKQGVDVVGPDYDWKKRR